MRRRDLNWLGELDSRPRYRRPEMNGHRDSQCAAFLLPHACRLVRVFGPPPSCGVCQRVGVAATGLGVPRRLARRSAGTIASQRRMRIWSRTNVSGQSIASAASCSAPASMSRRIARRSVTSSAYPAANSTSPSRRASRPCLSHDSMLCRSCSSSLRRICVVRFGLVVAIMGIGLGWRGRPPDVVVILSITTWQSGPCKCSRLAFSHSLCASRFEKGCFRGGIGHDLGFHF